MAHQWQPAPPPQYGGPAFQYQPQMPNAGQQQFQYNPPAPSPSNRQQYVYQPPVNQPRFDANSQLQSPNDMAPQYLSVPSNVGLFRPFGNMNLPPPPPPPPSFPPLPLPNATFGQFMQPLQASTNNFQNQYSPHGQPTFPSRQQQHQQHPVLEQVVYNTQHDVPPRMTIHQEVDSGNGNMGNTAVGTFPMRTQPFWLGINTASGILSRQDSDLAAPASSEGADSVSSYHPPSATPPEGGQTTANPSHGPSLADAGDSSKYQGRGNFEMRELAKGALLSLAPHNIKFSDLLAEGIDAHLLSQLFEEVGLKATQDVVSQPTFTNGLLPAGVTPVHAAPTKPTPAKSTVGVQPPTAGDQPVPKTISALPASGAALMQQNGISASATTPSTKGLETLPTGRPMMERKDRIAAMLAAKTGKVIPRKESPSSTPLNLPTNVLLPATPASKLTTAQPQSTQPGIPNESHQLVAPDSSSKSVPKPKSKAQTELVRQKMEHLKRESLAKTQAPKPSQEASSQSTSGLASGSPTVLLTYPQTGLPSKPVSQESMMNAAQLHRAASTTSIRSMSGSAQPSMTRISSSIPGLFMMEAEAEFAFPLKLDWDDPASSSVTVTSTSAADTKLLSGDSNHAKSQQPAPLDLSALSRESSSSRTALKRARAVDAFDEQDMPPAKHQDSRPTSSRGAGTVLNDEQSDDFSEGEIMEIDEESPVSPLPKTPRTRSFPPSGSMTATRPGGHFSSVQSKSQRGISYSVPNANQSGISASADLDIKLEMARRELHDAEERRKTGETALEVQSASPSTTRPPMPYTAPSPNLRSASNPATTMSPIKDKPAITTEDMQMQSPASFQSRSPAQFVAIDPVQRAKELKDKLLRQRTLKQGLPQLDNEVQKTQRRLAQLRREAEQREVEAREARKREKEIMEEVQRLEQQLEMGITGRQQFAQEMETLNQEMIPQGAATQIEESPLSHPPQPVASLPAVDDVNHSSYAASQLKSTDENMQEISCIPNSGDSGLNSDDESLRIEYNNRLVRPSAEAALPTAEEEEAFLQPESTQESASEDESNVSLRGDNGHNTAEVLSEEENVPDLDDSLMEVESDSDGSASMSDSGSEEYQPAEEPVRYDQDNTSDQNDDEYDPMDAPVAGGQSLHPDTEPEEYESAENLAPVQIDAATPIAITGTLLSTPTGSDNQPEPGDDREHGIELTEANTLTTTQQTLPSVAETGGVDIAPLASGPPASRFTPYQSALSNFKSFRFNSQFTDRVPDGYRSLTYSNTIDPTKPLCVTEAEGGLCIDVKCEEQHFRQMSLADEKILVQMSSANDIPDKTQRDRFVAGLKVVIADLRNKQISDFDTVASELATYRRRFRQEQDPSLAFIADEL